MEDVFASKGVQQGASKAVKDEDSFTDACEEGPSVRTECNGAADGGLFLPFVKRSIFP